jgi:hypothetical protein
MGETLLSGDGPVIEFRRKRDALIKASLDSDEFKRKETL